MLQLFKQMQSEWNLIPVEATYQFLMAACKNGRAPVQCLVLMKEMRAAGIAPTATTYKHAVITLAQGGRLVEMEQLLATAESSGQQGANHLQTLDMLHMLLL